MQRHDLHHMLTAAPRRPVWAGSARRWKWLVVALATTGSSLALAQEATEPRLNSAPVVSASFGIAATAYLTTYWATETSFGSEFTRDALRLAFAGSLGMLVGGLEGLDNAGVSDATLAMNLGWSALGTATGLLASWFMMHIVLPGAFVVFMRLTDKSFFSLASAGHPRRPPPSAVRESVWPHGV